MDRKEKLKVLGKLLDSGFDNEKEVIAFGLKDVKKANIKSEEIPVLIELQEATKNHKVISFFADELKKYEGGKRNE